jgi:hypothetical protein
VGARDVGDVEEAALLHQAVAEAAAAGGGGGVTCTVELHADRDHNLVTDMRDTGELHELLCRLVRGEEIGAGRGVEPAMAADFDGFPDCPDF